MSLILKGKRIRILFLVVVFALFFCCSLPSVQAASFFWSPDKVEGSAGAELRLGLFLDTEGEEINALEGKISFPLDNLELKEIRDGGSLISFWLDKPSLPRDCPNNICSLSFSGIIPSGYSGKQGLLLSLVFLSKESGSGEISLNSLKALKNDGLGSEAQLKYKNLAFNLLSSELGIVEFVSPGGPTGEILAENAREDKTPPELFQAELVRDPLLFEGRWVLVFSTQDKNSGLDHYEVKEGRSDFVLASSPYLIKNQKLNRDIKIKAVDRSGNEQIITVPASSQLNFYKQNRGYLILVLCLLLLVVVYLFIRLFRKKNN